MDVKMTTDDLLAAMSEAKEQRGRAQVQISMEIQRQAELVKACIGINGVTEGTVHQVLAALSKFAQELAEPGGPPISYTIETADLLGDFAPPAPAEKTLGDRRVELYLSTCNAWMFETPMNPQQLKLEKLLNERSHSKPETPRIAVDNLINCIDEALKEPM